MRVFARKESLIPVLAVFLACADLALESDRIPTSIDISPRGGFYLEGESEKLKVEVRDQNGELMTVPSWAPRWKITDTTIAQVARDGTMTAVGGGEVVVGVEVAGMAAATRFRMNPSEVLLSLGAAYVNQVAQNRRATVSLVPGRPALIRVFVIGDQTSYYHPSVRVTLFQGDEEVYQEVFPPRGDSTSKTIVESNLEDSHNGFVPGHLIRPGVGMVIELDPEGVVPLAPGSQTRYPETGTMALDVIEPPMLRQIFVPTIAAFTPDRGVHGWTDGLTPDSRQLGMTRTLLPVETMEVEIHEDYSTGADLRTPGGWQQWIQEMRVLYEQEDRRGYYYGVVRINGAAYGGLGYIGFPVSVGLTSDYIYAHELGHNMNLLHAPCGGAGGPDLRYPHAGGSIGIWGYDAVEDRLVDPNVYNDVMGYCSRRWISDYHFSKALDHRLAGDGGVVLDAEPAADGAAGEMLVIWGHIHDGQVTLDPAFVVDGQSALPETDGPYRVEGIGVDGRSEFSLSFSPTPLEHGGGGFVFFVPYRPEWAETLDRMVLTGPEGTDTVTRTGSSPMAVVTNPATGTIQAIIRDWDGGPLPGEGVSRVTITRGIPTAGGR